MGASVEQGTVSRLGPAERSNLVVELIKVGARALQVALCCRTQEDLLLTERRDQEAVEVCEHERAHVYMYCPAELVLVSVVLPLVALQHLRVLLELLQLLELGEQLKTAVEQDYTSLLFQQSAEDDDGDEDEEEEKEKEAVKADTDK